MAYSFDPQVRDAIVRIARNHGVDPMAALAVAMGEGGVKFGAVGDNNTSFGPFQLHVGGALPQGKDAAWANSIDGIRYAIRTMAGAGAKGLKGLDAINAIVRQFERPAAPDASVQNAWKRYQDPAFRQTLMDAVGPLPGQTPQMPGMQPMAAPADGAIRAAAMKNLASIASGEKYDPVKMLGNLVAERQAAAATVEPTNPSPVSSTPTRGKGTQPVQLPNGLISPIGTPFGKNSEFGVVDAEGAPGPDGKKYHAAKDWFAPAGTLVRSPVTGRIVEVKASRGNSGQVFGGVVKVQAPNGMVFVFRHIDPRKLQVGQDIEAGAPIAAITDWTGGGDHAHIEIWKTLEGGYTYSNMIDPVSVFGKK